MQRHANYSFVWCIACFDRPFSVQVTGTRCQVAHSFENNPGRTPIVDLLFFPGSPLFSHGTSKRDIRGASPLMVCRVPRDSIPTKPGPGTTTMCVCGSAFFTTANPQLLVHVFTRDPFGPFFLTHSDPHHPFA